MNIEKDEIFIKVKGIGFVFHYVGKKVGLCKDNKLKKCKAVKFKFEYEGCPYTMLFFVDKGPVGQQICGIINGKL